MVFVKFNMQIHGKLLQVKQMSLISETHELWNASCGVKLSRTEV